MNENEILQLQKEIIETYDKYVQLLGIDLKELKTIAYKEKWQSKNIKECALLRIKK